MSLEETDRISEDGHLHTVASAPTEEANELINAVDEMLENLTTRFTKISGEVFAKMDEMSQRLDDLETSLKGVENPEGEGGA